MFKNIRLCLFTIFREIQHFSDNCYYHNTDLRQWRVRQRRSDLSCLSSNSTPSSFRQPQNQLNIIARVFCGHNCISEQVHKPHQRELVLWIDHTEVSNTEIEKSSPSSDWLEAFFEVVDLFLRYL